MKYIVLLIFIGLAGCSSVNDLENEEQYIKIEKRVSDEGQYVDFNEIHSLEEVQELKNILAHADWEQAKMEMTHPPDYQFVFLFKNPTIDSKIILHKVWVSSQNQITLSTEVNQFSRLSKENSARFLELLTGKSS
ncbi:hypothetical protein [Bacillus suaedaesalsae]|uniref:YhfM-like domain-containing protein n=1 Tax=Bacillus suaedaesalsae TaxID=2810349 RepID=A0ABS2DE28_9BACI|nr:hypothetical protein [Bacillus suaedaesalsae]MBM6616681.1 hypothetical protein [Bacillus suaedaesalsae]